MDDFVTASGLTNTEIALSAIFCRILQQDHVDIHQHFVELGGDSILMVRLINELQKRFSVEIPVEMLFSDDGSVSGLASWIDAAMI